MANHKIDITKNGKTTLATAGKYCDRNVEVNVNVPEQQTQFTNLVNDGSTIIKYGYRPVSSGYTATENAVAIAIKVTPNQEAKVRFRGSMYLPFIYPANGNMYCADEVTADGYKSYSTIPKTISLDEHGDWMLTVQNPLKKYIIFGMGYTYSAYETVKPDAVTPIDIITLNEPIGNGGYVG